MSKDAAIAEIVKNLHALDLDDNKQILNFINQRKKKDKSPKSKPRHEDRDGKELSSGDEVYLLTGGVYNRKGEKGSVHTLPKTVGEYITFQRNRREAGETYNTYLRKLGRSVRKVSDKDKNDGN